MRPRSRGERGADDSAPDGDHVRIVVFDSLVRSVCVVRLSASDAGDLVGGDGGTGPRSAHEHATLGPALGDGSADGGGIVGVIDWLGVVGAEVGDRVTGRSSNPCKLVLQLISGVVGADGDAHGAAAYSAGAARV